MNRATVPIYRISANCLVIIIVLSLLILFSQALSLQIAQNTTKSLPQKFFLILEGRMPARYDYVAFSKKNQFYNKGFIKQVVGRAGDIVEIDEKNNVWLTSKRAKDRFPAGHIKELSLLGEKLYPIRSGIIPQNHYYVFAPHKDSLDSRYNEIGLIDSSYIIGRALPIRLIHSIYFIISGIILFILLRRILLLKFPSQILPIVIFSLIFLVANPIDLLAKDLGVHGKIYPIQEEDLASSIKDKLLAMEQTGELRRIQQEQQSKAKRSAERPKEVQGLSRAVVNKEFIYDPTIISNRDISDHQGNIVVPKGKRVNPLLYRRLPQRLLFIDGDNEEQVNWAFLKAAVNPSMIILTRGNIMQMMRDRKVRIYFDQNGYLVKTFGITALPAEVRQEGNILKIREEAL